LDRVNLPHDLGPTRGSQESGKAMAELGHGFFVEEISKASSTKGKKRWGKITKQKKGEIS
jgi:hypothetical protein